MYSLLGTNDRMYTRLGGYTHIRFPLPPRPRRLINPSSASSSGPSDEPPSEEGAQSLTPTPDIPPLDSWAEDTQTSTPTSSPVEDEWGSHPRAARSRPPPPRHPLNNAVFGLALGGIAVGAFFLGRQFNAVNKARVGNAGASSPPIAAVADDRTIMLEKKNYAQHVHSKGEYAYNPVTKTLEMDRNQEESKKFFEAENTIQAVGSIEEKEKEESDKVNGIEDKNTELKPSSESANNSAAYIGGAIETAEEAAEIGDKKDLPATVPEGGGAHRQTPSSPAKVPETTTATARTAVQEDESFRKLPLRTPQGAAALEKMRQLQQRRNQLYDRALARQDEKLNIIEAKEEQPPSSREGLDKKHDVVHDSKKQKGQKEMEATVPGTSTSKNSGDETSRGTSSQSDVLKYDLWVISEAAKHAEASVAAATESQAAELPQGMSLEELRERATAANKAAAASASAAHRAAAASALAADAADKAIHAAQQAALAAAKCQGSLDLHSADAIEKAYKAAAAAEEASAEAAAQAAVGAANAVMNERDAERHTKRAVHAGELSRPRGFVAQASAGWRQLRRNTAAAFEKTRENVGAGVEVAQGTWREGVSRAQAVGNAVAEGGRGAWRAVEDRLKGGKESK